MKVSETKWEGIKTWYRVIEQWKRHSIDLAYSKGKASAPIKPTPAF